MPTTSNQGKDLRLGSAEDCAYRPTILCQVRASMYKPPVFAIKPARKLGLCIAPSSIRYIKKCDSRFLIASRSTEVVLAALHIAHPLLGSAYRRMRHFRIVELAALNNACIHLMSLPYFSATKHFVSISINSSGFLYSNTISILSALFRLFCMTSNKFLSCAGYGLSRNSSNCGFDIRRSSV